MYYRGMPFCLMDRRDKDLYIQDLERRIEKLERNAGNSYTPPYSQLHRPAGTPPLLGGRIR